MKGRLYDPAVGRFLSPDIIVQEPEMGLSYNRYSYCLNNPLKYVDPSGWVFEDDWYQNKLNGDVYYNSSLHGEQDASKIAGEGWSYFGENGVFGKDELALAAQYNLPSKKKETNGEGFSLEISLKGADAKGFMQDMGYEFMPVESYDAISSQIMVNQILPGGGSVFVERRWGDCVVTESKYVDNNSVIQPFSKRIYQDQVGAHVTTMYSKTNYNYRRPYYLEKLLYFGVSVESAWSGNNSYIHENINLVYGWDNYNTSDKYMNQIKEKNQ